MKFVIAPDSFKGSLTAKQVAEAMKNGLTRIFPDADYSMVPMADGGEGTVQSLVDATHGHLITKTVHNPLDQLSEAYYGILGDGQTAVIEMAQASGIQYVNDETHNPMITTTYGTGELMLDAMDHGVKKLFLELVVLPQMTVELVWPKHWAPNSWIVMTMNWIMVVAH